MKLEELNILIEVVNGLFKNSDNGKYQTNPESKNDNNNDDVIFNTKEACSYLNISKSTLYKLTSSKSIVF